jgi:hypothetical protein
MPKALDKRASSTMRHAFSLSALGFVFLLLGAACGGGDETTTAGGNGSSATAASTTAPSETVVSTEDAEALSKSMLLRLTDFPTGWRADPSNDDDEGCAGIEKLTDRYNVLGKAESDTFAKGDLTEAASSAGIFGEEAEARDALNYLEASFQDESFRKCIEDSVRKDAGSNVSVGDVRVGQLSFAALGDRSSAWEIVVPLEAEGVSVTLYVDAVFIRTGSALGIVFFSDAFDPFDEQMREDLARVVEERMDEGVSEIE